MKNILLIGLGHFGKHVVYQLSQLGHDILAVDTNEDRVNEVLPYVTNAMIGDSTNVDFLNSLGVTCRLACRISTSALSPSVVISRTPLRPPLF